MPARDDTHAIRWFGRLTATLTRCGGSLDLAVGSKTAIRTARARHRSEARVFGADELAAEHHPDVGDREVDDRDA